MITLTPRLEVDADAFSGILSDYNSALRNSFTVDQINDLLPTFRSRLTASAERIAHAAFRLGMDYQRKMAAKDTP